MVNAAGKTPSPEVQVFLKAGRRQQPGFKTRPAFSDAGGLLEATPETIIARVFEVG
jgi:hypothetical protein